MAEGNMDLAGENSAGCACFSMLGFGWGRSASSSTSYQYLTEETTQQEGWVVRKAKEVREMSELLAGPKWKNFIRRFSNQGRRIRSMHFGYDAESYALNFDDGNIAEDEANARTVTRYQGDRPSVW